MMVPRATADTQRIRNGVGNEVQPNMLIDEPSSTSFPSPPQSDTTSTRGEPTRTKNDCSWTAFLAVASLLSAALVLRNFQAYTNISPPTSSRTVQKAALLGDGDAAAKHRRERKERHYHDRSTRISLFGENGMLTKLVAGYDDIPATTTTKAANEETASSVWDTNGPPVPRPEGEKRKSSKKHETQTLVSVNTRRGPGGGNTVGQSSVVARPKENSGTMQKHASEALQCRESVINFVINATDGKDECDGLIRAFDKTCSDNDQIPGPGRYRRWLQENRHRRPQRTRRLWNKLFVPHTIRLRSFLYQTLHSLERLSRLVLGEYFSPTPFFFAEDEVYKAWDDALYLVENNLDETVQKDARAFMHEQQCAFYEREDEKERIKWRRHLEHMEEEKPPSTPTNKTEAKHTAAMMNLPIKQGQHASEKMANDALLLQKGENLIKAANESFIAKEEAAKSKKSISDTSDAVSSVFNDPSSVEARTCCASILNVYHELCSSDEEEQVSDSRLFFLVLVMALCGMVKSLIRHFKILWLPEAAGCILVGVASGYALDLVPHSDISFDGNWFLRILVPPIIFEAALSIDKRSFNRHIVPIIIYAVAGTLLATYLTAAIVHHGTVALSGWCPAIPYVEALTFGALISSIDPIATLSVLHNMGMNDTDTIYVLIFGESLLNDGVAIVLFHTLVHFLDETLIIDREAIIAATVHFFVVAFGSLLVGVASGMLSTVYFWVFYGCQTPMVEVLMFFCWALLPYYVCDGIGWSGIVAAVAVGFVMDLHIVGLTQAHGPEEAPLELDMSEHTSASFDSNGDAREKPGDRGRRRIFNRYGHLSKEARTHIGFVTEIISTGMETAIFAYLGYFLFSHRYHWNVYHIVIAIFACCISRAIMIPSLGVVANSITRMQQHRAACQMQFQNPVATNKRAANTPAGVVIDKKMQIALWFAGLRGAMSFALVEHIPLYDSFSGEGTRLKPELKAMSSACIMFTVFVLGGYTYYMMENLGIAPSSRRNQSASTYETVALIRKGHETDSEDEATEVAEDNDTVSSLPGKARPFRRQRQQTSPHTLLTV